MRMYPDLHVLSLSGEYLPDSRREGKEEDKEEEKEEKEGKEEEEEEEDVEEKEEEKEEEEKEGKEEEEEEKEGKEEEEKEEKEGKEEEEEEEDEDVEEKEEEKEEEEEEEEKEGKEEEEECWVLCEAVKQMLVERLPLVLNLHLKRFVQAGRSLRKNGKHISFPPLLDMVPFCRPECKVAGWDNVHDIVVDSWHGCYIPLSLNVPL